MDATLSTGYSIPPPLVNEASRYRASWISQFRAVLWRSWISLIRDPMLIKVRFIQSVVIALLLGLVFYNQTYNQEGIMNINGAIFIILMNNSFSNMFSVINAFTVEQHIFLREHWNGMYRTDIYFWCKTIAEAPVLVFMTSVLVCIVYWMIGLNTDPKAFFICLAIMILVANTAASFGYLVSCLSSTLSVALSLATPLIMPLVLFGGFYLNANSVPVYFIWLKYISMFYYGNEALSINQWADVKNITCSPHVCIPNGKAVLASLNFKEDNFLQDILLIIALMVFFRILAFIALLIKSSRKT